MMRFPCRSVPIALLLPVILISASARAGEPWIPPRLELAYDTDLSPRAGADATLSLQYLAGRAEDRILRPRWWNEARFWPKTGGIAYRFGKLIAFDWPLLGDVAPTFQHEVFGHGYRAREFDYVNIHYEVYPSTPWGPGGGRTQYRIRDIETLSWDEDIAMAMAGVEADAVLAERMRGQWMQTGKVDYHGALLYLAAAGDLRNYLAVTRESDVDDPENLSNDMLHYISSLHKKEGLRTRDAYRLHLDEIEENESVALLDPFLWYSVVTLFRTYLWSGGSFFRYPAVPIGPVRFLPGIGYGLTPWGPEYRFESLASWGRRTFSLRYRIGDDTFHRSWGWDFRALEALSFMGATADVETHYWRQPRLRLGRYDSAPANRRQGCGGSLTLYSPPFRAGLPLRISLGGEYKTLGFVPGERLAGGPGLRAGVAWYP